jgi:hypothetical protein
MIVVVVVVVRLFVRWSRSVRWPVGQMDSHPKGEDQNLNTVVSSPSPVHVQTD